MNKKYDVAVVIGRFQPFHTQHVKLIEQALKLAKGVTVVIGSSNLAPSLKNPFSFEQRSTMIYNHFRTDDIHFVRGDDWPYNDQKWVAGIQEAVKSSLLYHRYQNDNPCKSVVLVGCMKDDSSYYLDLFPTWNSHMIPEEDTQDATTIRNGMFGENPSFKSWTRESMPDSTRSFLNDYTNSVECERLRNESLSIQRENEQYSHLRWPPIFSTGDAVVVQQGHVLLVERGGPVGKGQLALPGGYIESDEWIKDGIIRELTQETGLKIPEKVLKGSLKATKVFDAPNRDPRGRIITTAGYFNLTPQQAEGNVLPRVKGMDDAKKAFWMPISDLVSTEMFSDHYFIIRHFVG